MTQINVNAALSMEEARQKLARLKEFIPASDAPDVDGLLYDFGRVLTDYLNPELVPMGFVMACELALHDLRTGRTGVNSFTGKPIQSHLVGYPPMIHAYLRTKITTIADAIFPAEFAAEVKAVIEEINAKMAAEMKAVTE